LIASSVGVLLAVFLLVAGGLLTWAYTFVNNQVTTQLTEQQIVFPAANDPSIKALPPDDAAAMKQYAGQLMTTGAQAETYANHFIAVHLKEIGGGKTYSQLSVDRLVALMSSDHRLQVLDEPALAGREANRAAWHGYVTAFPDYVIYPDRFVHRGDEVLVLGSTAGSHPGLPDQDERKLTVIWRARVRDGLLVLWQVMEDSPGTASVPWAG
jgi:hypothetical protein